MCLTRGTNLSYERVGTTDDLSDVSPQVQYVDVEVGRNSEDGLIPRARGLGITHHAESRLLLQLLLPIAPLSGLAKKQHY